MKRIISTQFCVEKEFNNKKLTVAWGEVKENVLNLYKSFCEDDHKSKFRVIRREVTEEVIAESEDVRQSLFSFE